MELFRDFESAQRTMGRIESLEPGKIPGFLRMFGDAADPDLALSNLERWLKSTTNPQAQLEHLLCLPRVARLLFQILGSSQPLADALIQNPELVTLLTDPNELSKRPKRDEIISEGQRLLASASGYTHALDRLRFLKQSWMLRIVVNDLSGAWEQELVWSALSEVADGLISLAMEVAWREFCAQKGLRRDVPLSVIGLGKLGGSELNYSSDVDLVYVLADDAGEEIERSAPRFCELMTRALSERMGRGALYRVDLRLRPFGKSGPVAASMRAIEAYYRSHAQTWEAQALVRSRPVYGSADLHRRWQNVRLEHCFRSRVSSATIEEIVSMRQRIEAGASDADLKRGEGGIRDVEFLVQTQQMIHGHAHASVREPNTLEALRALSDLGFVSADAAKDLREDYRFLRKLEHRCQLAGDRQTHDIPNSSDERERLARTMSLKSWKRLEAELRGHRKKVRGAFLSFLPSAGQRKDPRQLVSDGLGEVAPMAQKWIDALPEAEAFYRSLSENRDSLDRVKRIAQFAPAIVPYFAKSIPLTEIVLSGEIEEDWDPVAEIDAQQIDIPFPKAAEAIRSQWVHAATRWLLSPSNQLAEDLTKLFDASVRHVTRRIDAEFDVIALGSYGTRDVSLASDLDFLWLIEDPSRQQVAETHAEQFLSVLGTLKRHGAPLSVDLRLRPEGNKGLLVRSFDGLRHYDLQGMEMWERFALGESRLMLGNPDALALVKKCAYAQPLTPERLQELLRMKERIESERVPAKYRKRHIKLGAGGISDVEWFLHLHEMRYPTATQAGCYETIPERLRALAQAELINALEFEALVRARTHLMAVRDRIVLLGFTTDIVPENPDKLGRLAKSCGFEDGYAFLKEHEGVTHSVRSIYLEGLERLRA